MMTLPLAKIAAISFSISGDDSNVQSSVVEVRRQDLYQSGKPSDYGVYDLHMGTNRYDLKCKFCLNNKSGCLGHFGHFELNTEIISSLFYNYIIKWLKEICHRCGSPIAKLSDMQHIPPEYRFRAKKTAYIRKRNGKYVCRVCGAVQPNITMNKEKKLPMVDMRDKRKKLSEATAEEAKTQILLPKDLAIIFNRVSNETVEQLGMPISSHPKNMVLKAIRISPNTIRPENRVPSLGRAVGNETTIALQNIIKQNSKVPHVIPEEVGQVLEADIIGLNDQVHAMVSMPKKQGARAQMSSLASSLAGKGRIIRGHLLGKRTRQNARSFISGDPKLKFDEVGVPIKFAKIIQIEETLQEYNKERLMIYFMNGRAKYPGCTKVIKSTGEVFEVNDDKKDHINPENGDIICRDLIDGDRFIFNRQPTLMPSNLTAMKVVIIHDITINTLTLNVIVCALFAADFDGDAMNAFFVPSVSSRAEIGELSTPRNVIIKHGPGTLLIGNIDDSIVGSYLLSKAKKINRYSAALIFSTATFVPDLMSKKKFSGNDLYSMILQRNNAFVTYRAKPNIYNKVYDKHFHYDPKDIEVAIDNGEIISGVLDKKAIGKGGRNNLYHIIYQEKGPDALLDIMYNFQQVVINHAYFCGFSLGLDDMILPRKALKEIHKIVDITKKEAELVTKDLDEQKIIPPMAKTVEEHYEELQMEKLNFGDKFLDIILEHFKLNNNNLLKLTLTGSKGSINYVSHISAAIGCITIGGQRPPKQLSHGRTLAFFNRFDTSPEANGFVANSYISGLPKSSVMFSAQDARRNFFHKSLSTAKTGALERESIMSLQSITTNYQYSCVKNTRVIQQCYGDNGLDTRKCIMVEIPTIMLSDEDVEQQWHYRAKDNNLQKIFDAEFSRIKEHRELFRQYFQQISMINYSEGFGNEVYVSINLARNIKDAMITFGKFAPSERDIAQMVEKVEAFVADLPYVFANDNLRAKKGKLPLYLHYAILPLQILVQAELAAKQSLQYLNNDILEYLFQKILYRQKLALIDYGNAVGLLASTSFSEPITQDMLKSTHGTVSGRGVAKSVLDEINETFGTTDLSKLKKSSMVIMFKPDYEQDYNTAYHVASIIEEVKIKNLAKSPCRVFFEPFGAPKHPAYRHEKDLIDKYVSFNQMYQPPNNLSNWCIRFEFLRTEMIHRDISLIDIIARIREVYPLLYIVHSSENSHIIMVRIYIRMNMFTKKGEEEEIMVEKLANELIEFTVRGIKNILAANVLTTPISYIKPDGSVGTKKVYAVKTIGLNFYDVAKYIKEIDITKIYSESPLEVQHIFGVEKSQALLANKIKNMGSGDLQYAHAAVYSSEMTSTGQITPIKKRGTNMRNPDDPLLRMGFASPVETLVDSAVKNVRNPIGSVSSSLMVGAVPNNIGTNYSKIYIDEKMLEENTKDVNKYIEEL